MCRDLDTEEVSSRELAQRSCVESSFRDLVILCRDLAKRSLTEILPKELL